jgi:hypothetical protein
MLSLPGFSAALHSQRCARVRGRLSGPWALVDTRVGAFSSAASLGRGERAAI